MCSVDFVARSIVTVASKPGALGKAFHIANPTTFRFRDYFAALVTYGFDVKFTVGGVDTLSRNPLGWSLTTFLFFF